MIETTDRSFEEDVIKSDKLTVVDFWAEWCGPCRMLAPVFEEVSKIKESVKFVKVDIDNSPQTAAKYGIMSIPTIVLFKDGEIVHQLVGPQQKDKLVDEISKFE